MRYYIAKNNLLETFSIKWYDLIGLNKKKQKSLKKLFIPAF